jgi:hypothetical protein
MAGVQSGRSIGKQRQASRKGHHVKKPAQAAPAAGEFRAVQPATDKVRLSDEAVSQGLADLKARLQDDPGFSRQLLKNAGILTTRGRLAKSFGG